MFAAVIAVCSHGYAESPLKAMLTLAPSTVLPGLPTAFRVTIINASNETQQIVDAATLSVTTKDVTFDAEVNGGVQTNLPADQMEKCNASRCLNLPPLATKELYFDFGPSLAGNQFFYDPRLSNSGSYDLKLTFHAFAANGSEMAISTQPAALVVEQPRGADAEAWTWLAEQAGANSPAMTWALRGNAIAAYLRAHFPNSEYVKWAAALGAATKEEQLANLDAALGTNPPPGLHDALLFAKGSLLVQWNRVAIYSLRDLQAALNYADAATATLSTLRDNSVSSYMRQRAAALIGELYTTKTGNATLRELAATDPPAPLQLVPRVECVSRGTGQAFSARFGYLNPNRGQKVLDLGDANQITPAPRDQGQPRVFKPGDHSNVFTASSPGGELKWHLDGTDAVATAQFAMRCSGQ